MAYPTLSIDRLLRMPVGLLAAPGAHLWLWTTNQFLETGFHLMRAWGFKYLAPVHMVKPSGIGNWFVNRTQTMLMGYRDKCRFNGARYLPNVIPVGSVPRHSQKPEATYEYIESVSEAPRLDLFARQKRPGWYVWGNEVESDIELIV